MTDVRKSVLVPYTAAQMFALVDDIESYPQFLPWCGGSKILSRDAQTVRASVEINYHGVRQHFTTENTLRPAQTIDMRLVEGPFSKLEGEWRFTDLGDAQNAGCRVELHLHYTFSNAVLAALVGKVFDMIANTLVDAFVKRARQVYG